MRQRVFEGLGWDALFEHFDEITASGYSVSVFTRWGEAIDQVWVKSRVTDAPEQTCATTSSARPRRPSTGTRSSGSTRSTARRSSGAPGPWSDRLPHFRMGFTPSSGEELQSEYLRAARARRARRSRPCARSPTAIRPLLQVSEIRTIAADRLWMSPQYGQRHGRHPLHLEARARTPSSACSPTSRPRSRRSSAPALGQALPRRAPRRSLRSTSACPTSSRLVERLDPRGAFRNAWLEERVLDRA